MSKESYVRGFCKAAETVGVNPVALAKYAQQVSAPTSAPPARVSAPSQTPQQGHVIYRNLTKDEQKKHFFPHWYSYLNPMNHFIAGAAKIEDRAPAR